MRHHPSQQLLAMVLTLHVLCLASAAVAQTTEQVLYQFAGGTDGASPVGALIMDKAGNLYGATSSGGTFGLGTAFELTPTSSGWIKTVLYNFAGGTTDGSNPNGGLVFDTSGNLYGVTATGGPDVSSCGIPSGCGTLYELSPDGVGGWSETILHIFSFTDGTSPNGSLAFDTSGNIYGTTSNGGPCCSFLGGNYADGTVYELSLSGGVWNYAVLHGFCGSYYCGYDGTFPNGGVVFDKLGNLYGTTISGGGDANTEGGIVFELSPSNGSWQETVVHAFVQYNFSAGINPDSPVAFDSAGNLYGATYYGVANTYCPGYNCGLIYELTPSGTSWTENVIFDFPGGAGGAYVSPSGGGLTFDSSGNLYGATSNQSNADVVFQLTRNVSVGWSENIFHTFAGPDGYSPQAAVIFDAGGNLYGVASAGGNNACAGGCGLIFELTAQSQNIGSIGSNNPQATYAEPVSTGNGNYFYQHTDLTVPGRGLPIVFSRSYNALDTYSGPLGANWTHSYNVLLTDSGSSIAIKWGDGHTENYALTSGVYVPPPGVHNSLVKNPDGGYALTQKDQTKNNFSSAGQFVSLIDKNGNKIALSYDGNGNLIQFSDTVGRIFTLSYNSSKQLTQIKDPIGRTESYTYSSSGDLATATDPLKGLTTYGYDSAHHVTSITLPGSVSLLANVYDSSGRVTSQTNGRNFTTTFAYNTPTAGQTTITDPLGNTTVHTYDNLLRVTQITDALSGTASYAYDTNNNRISVSNKNGQTTNYTYDGMGNVTGITDPLQGNSSFTYDSLNDLLGSTNPRGNTTMFTYDTNGNLTAVQDALTDKTTFAHDSYGELTAKTDANSHKATYAYDTQGNLTKSTDALSHATNMGYDGISRLISVTDANKHRTTSAYDALSRLTKTTDPLGNATQFKYSPVSNLTKVTDGNGKSTSYAYDAANNLISVTDAAGRVTKYGYDANNNRTSFTNANNRNTTYLYDKLNRLSLVTDPVKFTTAYAYDAAGNVLTMTDANGHATQLTYDALNRVTGITYFDGTSVAYAYDADGDRTSMVDSRGTTTYCYDALDRVSSVAQPDSSTVSYAYDAVGHRSVTTYPDGKNVAYGYDAANRLNGVTDWLSRTTSYSYDAANRLTGTAYPNAAAISLAYDAANRLTQVSNTYPASAIGSSAPFSSYTYLLDKVGNRTRVTDGAGNITTYGYDSDYELTSVTNPLGTTTYTYDKAGNRLTLNNGSGTTSFVYDGDDRLTSVGTTKFTYDKNGNRTKQTAKGQTLTYAYDAVNRLVSVTGGSQTSTFAYDGDGHRVSQTVGSGTYTYTNDVAVSLPVVLQENGPDSFVSYNYGLGLVSESGSTFEYFYHADGLSSIVGLTDDTGTLHQGYLYDAWGNDGGSTNYVGTENKFRYTGQAIDPGTGIYFLRARYLDENTARFMSRDTALHSIKVPLGLNRYTYALSNPARYSDPSGLGLDWIGSLVNGSLAYESFQQSSAAEQNNINCVLYSSGCTLSSAQANAPGQKMVQGADELHDAAVDAGSGAYSGTNVFGPSSGGSAFDLLLSVLSANQAIKDIEQLPTKIGELLTPTVHAANLSVGTAGTDDTQVPCSLANGCAGGSPNAK